MGRHHRKTRERFGHDADDFERLSVRQTDGPANDTGVGVELTPPERVTQDGGGNSYWWRRFSRRKDATKRRVTAKRREKPIRHELGADRPGILVASVAAKQDDFTRRCRPFCHALRVTTDSLVLVPRPLVGNTQPGVPIS